MSRTLRGDDRDWMRERMNRRSAAHRRLKHPRQLKGSLRGKKKRKKLP